MSVKATCGHAETEWVSVALEAGPVAGVVLRYLGPDLDRIVAVRTHWKGDLDIAPPDPASVLLEGPGIEPRQPDQSLRFAGVPPGEYCLTIDDPRFERKTLAGVRPGPAVVDVTLRGTAAIDLRVTERPRGAPCPRFQVVLWPEGWGGMPRLHWKDGEMAPLADRPDGRVVLEGMVPGTWNLAILAEGRSMLERVEALAPRETRAVEASFGARGALAGRVVENDGTTPCAKLMVSLLRPAAERGSAASPANAPLDDERPAHAGALRARTRVAQAWTDRLGGFRFDSLEPGRYVVATTYPRGMQVEREVEVEPGTTAEPRLVLPPGVTITGRLLAPEGASFERTAISFEDAEPGGGFSRGVEPDGSFRIGPVAAGRAKLLLHRGSGTNPDRLLEELTLVPGVPVARTYDLRPSWPGTVTVTVTRDGKPAREVTAWLHEPGKEFTAGYYENGDRKGVATFGEVLAGRYVVTVTDKMQRAWRSMASAPVDLAPGGRAAVKVALVLAERELLLVDAQTGEALRETKVDLMFADTVQSRGTEAKTDASGRLRFTMALGARYFVRRHEDVWKLVYDEVHNAVSYRELEAALRDQAANLNWIDGADVITVRVPRWQ